MSRYLNNKVSKNKEISDVDSIPSRMVRLISAYKYKGHTVSAVLLGKQEAEEYAGYAVDEDQIAEVLQSNDLTIEGIPILVVWNRSSTLALVTGVVGVEWD